MTPLASPRPLPEEHADVAAAETGDVAAAVARYHERGYAVFPRLFSLEEVESLAREIRRFGERQRAVNDLDKDGMRFFPNVFRGSETVRGLIASPRLVARLVPFIGPDFWVRWDQAVAKCPGGAGFPWHQDNAYNRLEDEHHQLWVAVTEMDAENGQLRVAPGSHRRGLLPHGRIDNHAVCHDEPGEVAAVDARPGDVVLFSSLLLHATPPNRSDRERWAYVVEYVSSRVFDPYLSPPYFVAARGGRPCGRFVCFFRGRLSPANLWKYRRVRSRAALERALGLARRAARAVRSRVRARLSPKSAS